ncbi:MAG: hypothetical protein CBC49_009050 [Alphaproteobacteria bacterium TMED89]|nr:hypothetical protein [Rhodospirillaceae bacterium]MAV48186.1 hypothetical protein [Rhodospirillaceae bacterium]RPH11925.1 MAG: hypothetical protein CBC49_008825 [Alphaproteobacteria bacterium TMED89]RPH11962.1 MAG: hypothetical protein CBC49_009050 [Alphaproteobacteria bacterium TMED89]
MTSSNEAKGPLSLDAPAPVVRTGNNSVVWAALAGLLQVALAISAGVIAYWQVTEQWAVQNEQAARDAFKDFLKISMDNPAISGGLLSDYEYTEQDDERYFWYVTLMTETFEQVLAYVPNVQAWIDLLELQVDIHCEFYASEGFQPELYSTRLQTVVDKVLAQGEC